MKKIFLCLMVILMVLAVSCRFGVDSSSNPQNVFNSFMELYKQNYAYIYDAEKTPSQIYDEFWPRVRVLENSEAGMLELAQVFADIEGILKDDHVSVEHSYHYTLIKRTYFPRVGFTPDSTTLEKDVEIQGDSFAYTYGQIKDDSTIGYILVKELSKDISAFNRVNDDRSWLKEIDPIINNLKDKGVKKMILDIRSAAGGSQTNAEYIISRFIDQTRAYMVSYDLIGPADSRASYQRQVTYISPNSSGAKFSGSVVLLMSAETGSGGEVFALAAKQIPNLKIIGDNSGGLPGTIAVYDLPNYWTLQLTTSKTYPINPDGTDGPSYLTVGLEPDIKVPNNYYDTSDKVLLKGIEVIKGM